jgi:hypothetical protein
MAKDYPMEKERTKMLPNGLDPLRYTIEIKESTASRNSVDKSNYKRDENVNLPWFVR